MKTFFLDIDGVIYKDGIINKKVIEIIKKNKNKYIFCTGRGYLRCIDVVKKHINPNDIVILENGGCIKEKKIIQYHNIPLNIKKIIDIIDPKSIEYIVFSVKEENEYYSYGQASLLHVKSNYTNFNEFLDLLHKSNTCQITIKFKCNINKSEFIKMCQDRKIEYKLSEKYVIINRKGVSKKSAIEYIIKRDKIDKSDCIIVGNDYNDIDMFNIDCYKKIGILDENTPDEIKIKSTDLVSFEELPKLIEKHCKLFTSNK